MFVYFSRAGRHGSRASYAQDCDVTGGGSYMTQGNQLIPCVAQSHAHRQGHVTRDGRDLGSINIAVTPLISQC